MLAMLMLNAILGDVTEDYMMRHFRSQTILAANSTSVFELEREFGRASCDSAGSEMSLLFVRAYGKEIYRGDVKLFACRRYVELLYLYDTSECELNLLEPEKQLLNTTYEGCPTIVVFDKKGLEDTDIELQLLLTFWLVAILVVGMAFIGSDMQAHLISPIERLTKVIKVVSGKAWRKRAKEAAKRDSDDGDDGEKQEQTPPLKRAADFIDGLRQDVYTVSRMARLVMDDMQKLYGFQMGKYRHLLHAFETGFDKLYMLVHSALLEFDKQEMPIDVLAHGLWRMCAENTPNKLTHALSKGTLGRAAHLVTMLEFPLKMAADSGQKVLVEQMKRTLGVTPGLEDGRVCLGDFQSFVLSLVLRSVQLQSVHIGQPPPEALPSMGLVELYQHSRALGAALLIERLNATAHLGITARCDSGSPSEIYTSLIGCVLAAVKRACHEAGLEKSSAVELSSLHRWLRETENELRHEYRQVVRRHGLVPLTDLSGGVVLDLVGDGMADTALVDTTGDGRVDTIQYMADTMLVDTTGDGRGDAVEYSIGRGNADFVPTAAPSTTATGDDHASLGRVRSASLGAAGSVLSAVRCSLSSGSSKRLGASPRGGGEASRPLSAAGRAKQLERMTMPQLKALAPPSRIATVPADLIPTEAQAAWLGRLDSLTAALPASPEAAPDSDGAAVMKAALGILELLGEVDRLCRALSQRPPPETRLQSMPLAEAAAHLDDLGFPGAMLPSPPTSREAAPPLRSAPPTDEPPNAQRASVSADGAGGAISEDVPALLEVGQDYHFLSRLGLAEPEPEEGTDGRGASFLWIAEARGLLGAYAAAAAEVKGGTKRAPPPAGPAGVTMVGLQGVVAAVTGGGALWRLRRRYVRLHLAIALRLPRCDAAWLENAEAREHAEACLEAMDVLHDDEEEDAQQRHGSPALSRRLSPASHVRFHGHSASSMASTSSSSISSISSISLAQNQARQLTLRKVEKHASRGQQLSERYNALRDQLERAASEDAAAALFLPHVEGCTQVLTNFVAVSYPLSTLAHIVAGQQLTQAKAWRDLVTKAAKEEWKSGKPPAQVLVAVMEQLGPEHKEVTGRVLEMVREIEQWWARLQQESAAPPTPAPAPPPSNPRISSILLARGEGVKISTSSV